ncbi:hypothetical protein [Saprospira grandis]|uniref:hypothetical protein n=1 Tax=Saprospira grandis TaxID=1008 RepID=UPI0022DD07F7|nr:hypothetical protein [Saprospira grandis]WBM74147.1 hypothetical protein OP864_14255 [Saprospira grandis]
MDVIAIGTNQPAYVEGILPSDYEIYWDYKLLNTNSECGLALLQKHYSYQALGVLMKSGDNSETDASHGIIADILAFHLGETATCPFFDFLEALAPILTEKNACCLSFSIDWDDEGIPVRLHRVSISEAKERLNCFTVWTEVYYQMEEDLYISCNEYPLLFQLYNE